VRTCVERTRIVRIRVLLKSNALLFWLMLVAGTVFDRVVKTIQVSRMMPGQSCTVIPQIVDFTYVRNPGVGFGLFPGVTWLPLGVSVLVLSAIVGAWYVVKPMSRLLAVGLALLGAGAIGNTIDRVLYGYVIDLFDLAFIDFPVFNVADMLVNSGCVLLIVWVLFISDRQSVEPAQPAGDVSLTRMSASDEVVMVDEEVTVDDE